MIKIIKKKIKKIPYFGQAISSIYLRIRYVFLIIRRNIKPLPKNTCEETAMFPRNNHYFFGYYDKSPWDPSGRYFLSLKTTFANRMPNETDYASICIMDKEHSNTCEIAVTRSWSWQQGAMLQWLNTGQENNLLYNNFHDGEYVTIICDKHGNFIKRLPRPTYAVSPDGLKALSLNFSRLHFCRPGYGYVNKKFKFDGNLYPLDDGIFTVDINTGHSELIISLEEIVRLNHLPEFEDSMHYFNHLEFNPNGDRFVFFHRWRSRLTGIEKTRFYSAACDGSDVFCLADYGMVSHFCWKDNFSILAWVEHPSFGKCYCLFQDKSEDVVPVGRGILTEDGHPSFSSDGRLILTDTYPDKNRYRNLLLYDTKKSKLHVLAKYFVPLIYGGPLRCDLHPRWGHDCKSINFDSVHEGVRGVYTVDISNILEVLDI